LKSPSNASLHAVLFLSLLLHSPADTARAQPSVEWQAAFGGSGDDYFSSMRPTPDGGYIVGGSSESGASGNKTHANFGDSDGWLVKVDGSGVKQWDQAFGGSGTDYLESVQPTSDGGYILGGESGSGVSGNKTNASFGGYDCWLVKVDSSGVKQWEKGFGGSGLESLMSVQQTGDGGYILGGESASGVSGNKTSANFGSTDYWLVKVDGGGNKQWEKVFGGNSDDNLLGAEPTSDGGYILGGFSGSGVSGNKTTASFGVLDYWVVKVDGNGTKQWEKAFGGSSYDYLRSVQQTSDGGYILGGYSFSGISGNKTNPSFGGADYWLIKLDSNGNKQWEKVFGGSSDDNLFSARQTSDGGFILGGWSQSGVSGNKTVASFGDYDYWIVKTDASGNKQWEKVLGGSAFEALFTVEQTSDQGFMVGGHSRSGISGGKTNASFGGSDNWLVKLAANPLALVCPTNKTVACGSIWSFDIPTALDGCCTNKTIAVLSTVTNGNNCSQTITRTWQASDCCSNSVTCSQTVTVTDTTPPVITCSTSKSLPCGTPWVFDQPTALDACSGPNVTIVVLNTVTNGSGCLRVFTRTWRASDGCANSSVCSQTVTELPDLSSVQWEAAFGGNSDENLYSVEPTSDGGFILGGSSFSGESGNKTIAGFGSYDYWLVKVDGNGLKQWEQVFGGEGDDVLYSAHQTSDGGYILGGSSFSGISGNKETENFGIRNYWLVKVDGTGTKQWEQVFGGDSDEHLRSVQQTGDGGYILGGWSYSGESGNKTSSPLGEYDYWLVKVDGSGNKLWERVFGGGGPDILDTVRSTSDGGYILGGSSASGMSGNKTTVNFGNLDGWLVKVDGSGNKQWEKDFGGNGYDFLQSVQPTGDGGYILGGYSDSGVSGNKTNASYGGNDYWLVKVDGSGNKQWEKAFGGSGSDILNSVQQTRDGGYILGGHSDSGVSGNKTNASFGINDYWVVKVDGNGNKQWEKVFGGALDDTLSSVRPTSDGGYILGGRSESGFSGNKTNVNFGSGDYWLVKLKPSSPILTALPITNGTFTLRLSGLASDLNIVIYASTNLPVWTPIFTNSPVNGSFEYVDSPPTNAVQRYYRATLTP
jgi:hypothetical protein